MSVSSYFPLVSSLRSPRPSGAVTTVVPRLLVYFFPSPRDPSRVESSRVAEPGTLARVFSRDIVRSGAFCPHVSHHGVLCSLFRGRWRRRRAPLAVAPEERKGKEKLGVLVVDNAPSRGSLAFFLFSLSSPPASWPPSPLWRPTAETCTKSRVVPVCRARRNVASS